MNYVHSIVIFSSITCCLRINNFGFRRKHRTVDAMVEFIERIRTCTNKLIKSFFLDLKKAFEMIDHQILLHKLECYGVRGNSHKWFASYLSNRYQRVQVNGCLSNWRKLKCGVPQGSILGPLLFIIYINDITACCKFTNIIMFADDTNISSIGSKPDDIETDLNEIGCWLLANKLFLNLDKTVQLNLSASASNHQYSMNNCPVIIKQRCKYLGLNLDSKLN